MYMANSIMAPECWHLSTSRAWCRTREDADVNEVKCGQCSSTNVSVVSSDETRAVIVVQCFDCDKTSEVDVEKFQVDTDDLPPE